MKTLRSSPRFAKKNLPRLVLIVSLSALLIGAAATVFVTSNANGRPLNVTPTTTRIPDFEANANAVPGWQRKELRNVFGNYVVYGNASNSCTLLTNTLLFNQAEHGKGDESVSHSALRFQFSATDAQLTDQERVRISVKQGGSLEFLVAHRTQASTSTWVAVRSIDTLRTVPVKYLKTVPKALQEKYSRAIPTLVAQYQCSGGKGSAGEFKSLLAALSVDLR